MATNQKQKPLCPLNLAGLTLGDQTIARKVTPVVAKAKCLGDPSENLQIPQSTWALFAIGL